MLCACAGFTQFAPRIFYYSFRFRLFHLTKLIWFLYRSIPLKHFYASQFQLFSTNNVYRPESSTQRGKRITKLTFGRRRGKAEQRAQSVGER